MTSLRRFALLALLGAIPAPSRADESAAPLRVFYTGHSFHMFVPPRVALTAKAAEMMKA